MLAGRRPLQGGLAVALCAVAGLAILYAAATSLARLLRLPYHPPTWATAVALGVLLAYGIAAARLVRASQRRGPGEEDPSGASRAVGVTIAALLLAPVALSVAVIPDGRHGGLHVDPALQVIGKAAALGLGAVLLIAAAVIALRSFGPKRRAAAGRHVRQQTTDGPS